MSRTRTIKADGDVVDEFEFRVREDIHTGKNRTWTQAIVLAVGHKIDLEEIFIVLCDKTSSSDEKVKQITNIILEQRKRGL